MSEPIRACPYNVTLKPRGRLAPTSYLFERKGLLTLEPTLTNQSPTLESLFDTTINADLNIEDIRITSSSEAEGLGTEFELLTPLSELGGVNAAFGSTPLSEDWVLRKSEMTYEPVEGVDVVEDGEEGEGIREDKVEGLFKLVDALEMESDITQVWTNLAK